MTHARIRIAHITDLHLRQHLPGSSAVLSRRSRDMAALFSQAIQAITDHKVDFIAVTGDLLDVPNAVIQPSDYYDYRTDLWLPEIEADYRLIKEILDGAGVPYMVLPGNHDHEPSFWKVFDIDANIMTLAGGFHAIRFVDREWDAHVPRRIDRERRLMERMLSAPDHRSQIHLQHYVITPQIDHSYPHNYFEHDHLRRQISESGRVALVLSGHYHPGLPPLTENAATFSTAPAFCEFPHAYRIGDVTPDEVNIETFTLLERPVTSGKKVVFLDRDGVIITLASYSTGPDMLEIIPGAADAIRRLHEAGYVVVVNTYQSCVGSGYVLEKHIHGNHDHMCRLLRDAAGDLAQPDWIVFSVGAGTRAIHPKYESLADAKPNTVLFDRAVERLELDRTDAYMIGDRATDIDVARRMKATPILVRTGDGKMTEDQLRGTPAMPEHIFNSLADAVDYILRG